MENNLQTEQSSLSKAIGEAVTEIQGILTEVMSQGANDFEMSALLQLIPRVQKASKIETVHSFVESARLIRDTKMNS